MSVVSRRLRRREAGLDATVTGVLPPLRPMPDQEVPVGHYELAWIKVYVNHGTDQAYYVLEEDQDSGILRMVMRLDQCGKNVAVSTVNALNKEWARNNEPRSKKEREGWTGTNEG